MRGEPMGYGKHKFVLFMAVMVTGSFFGLWGDGVSQAEIKAPLEFQAARLSGLGNTLSKCLLNPLANTAEMIVNGLSKDKKKSSTKCSSGSTAVPEKPDCDDFKYGSGLSDSAYKAYKDKIDGALGCIQDEKSKLAVASSKLTCLQAYSTQLNEMIGSLKGAFTQTIADAQKGIQTYEAEEKDIQTRGESLAEIMGDEEKGGGLLGARKTALSIIEKMPDEVNQIKELQKQNSEARKSLESAIAKRPLALMGDCFTAEMVPGLKCTTNGEDLTMYAWALCYVRESQRIGPKGQLQKNKVVQQQGLAAEAQLKTVLDQMIASLPSDTTTSDTMEQNTAKLRKTGTVSSFSDLQGRYLSILKKFDKKANISGNVMSRMKNCYNSKLADVEKERKTPDTFIYAQQEKIKSSEDKVKTEVTKLLNKYSLVWGESMTALTSMNLPITTLKCEQSDPTAQLACLEDFKVNTMHLLKGTGTGTTVKMTLKGTKAENDGKYAFTCNGINGCITELKNRNSAMKVLYKQTVQAKQAYANDANSKMKKYAQQMASAMSGQSKQLQDMATEVGGLLSGLGIRGGVKLSTVPPEKFQQGKFADGSPGLYEEPDNVLGIMSGFMNQPLNVADSEAISSAQEGVAEKKSELDRKEERAADMTLTVKKVWDNCKKNAAKEMLPQIQTLTKCAQNGEWCLALYDTTSSANYAQGLTALLADLRSKFSGVDNSFEAGLVSLEKGFTSKDCKNVVDPGALIAAFDSQNFTKTDLEKQLDDFAKQCSNTFLNLSEKCNKMVKVCRDTAGTGNNGTVTECKDKAKKAAQLKTGEKIPEANECELASDELQKNANNADTDSHHHSGDYKAGRADSRKKRD